MPFSTCFDASEVACFQQSRIHLKALFPLLAAGTLTMRTLSALLAIGLTGSLPIALPSAAHADDNCRHTTTQNLKLDLDGVKSLLSELGEPAERAAELLFGRRLHSALGRRRVDG